MTKFTISITINQPIEIVVNAFLNPDNITFWTTDLEKFEVVKREPGEVGSIARLHYTQKGRKYVMEDKMIYCEPGKKYVSEVTGDALTANVETTFHSSGNQTEVKMTWAGRGKIFLLKLILPLLRGKIKKHAMIDLEKFKNLVETRGIDFKLAV